MKFAPPPPDSGICLITGLFTTLRTEKYFLIRSSRYNTLNCQGGTGNMHLETNYLYELVIREGFN